MSQFFFQFIFFKFTIFGIFYKKNKIFVDFLLRVEAEKMKIITDNDIIFKHTHKKWLNRKVKDNGP